MKRTGSYYVYIVESSTGTYYTGSTNDLDNRIKLHNSGRGAKYLRGKAPVKLVYAKKCRNYGTAAKRERRIKAMTRAEKAILCADGVNERGMSWWED